MELEKDLSSLTVGFAMTGSFCTMAKAIQQLEVLAKACGTVVPIMSEVLAATDTRFGKAADFINLAEKITGCPVIKTIKEAEPIGPKKRLDALIIAPCTGNTLSKLANAITDTSVTMAAKAQLRNKRPVIIGVSTNDGLGINGKNIGMLLSSKNIYFVPFGQDDPIDKENSLVCDMDKILHTLKSAINGEQIQPVII